MMLSLNPRVTIPTNDLISVDTERTEEYAISPVPSSLSFLSILH